MSSLPPDPGSWEPSNATPRRGSGVKVGCLVTIGILVLGGVIGGLSSCGKGSKPYDPNNEFEVKAQCEDRVKSMLKAPSTAKFDNETATGSGTWTVTGTVDSENGFGALLQAEFQCTVTVDGDTLRTRVDSLG